MSTQRSLTVGALARVRGLALEEAAVREAITRLEQTDLTAQPAGRIDWREFRIDWDAAAVEAPRPGRTGVGGVGLYELTLQQVRLSVYHGEQLIGRSREHQGRIVQGHVLRSASPLPAQLASRMFDENPPHCFRRRGKKVSATVPMSCLVHVHKSQVRLVHQRRSLKGLPRFLLG